MRMRRCFTDGEMRLKRFWALPIALVVIIFVIRVRAQDPQKSDPWPPTAAHMRLHLVGQAHIDPVWLWQWPEGVSVVHSTFRSALDRMNENPDFKFTASSAQFYEWVAENDPAMLKEIRKRVEEGRWSLVGGWWVEPDVNMPSGESLARQGLYGQRSFERLFGRMATVGYNPDSFGHPGTLPQILKLQGIRSYVFMRPGPHEKREVPGPLFWWEGLDGTRMLTYRIPFSYNGDRPVKHTSLAFINEYGSNPVKSLMEFYGAGDHGGGATIENIRSISSLQSEEGAPKVIFSTPEDYFAEAQKIPASDLPSIKDDLQHHAVGCYTVGAEIKKANRNTEAALTAAEKLASIGSAVWGATYPKSALTSAWERVLFLQFHDSFAGTTLPEHFQAAREGFGYATDIANQALYKSAQALAWQVPTEDPQSEYLVVFNPHPWPTIQNVEYELDWDKTKPSRVEDDKGEAVPFQWSPSSTVAFDRQRLVARVSVPAFGYRQIRVRPDAQQKQFTARVHAENSTLENEYLRVIVSPDGTIGILDKATGKQVFRGGETGARAAVLNDPSDTWGHGVKAFKDELGAFQKASVKVLENGPLRAILRVRSSYNNSALTTDWILYAGSSALEANVKLDWQEHLKMLKLSFPVDVDNSKASYEVPYGYMVRESNGNEDPGQRWIDITGQQNGKEYGLAVINDAKYGYSVSGNDMRISIARSPVFAHHQPRTLQGDIEYQWEDQGIQTFRLMLLPHTGPWQQYHLSRKADEFLQPAPVIYQGIHRGSRPQSASFLSIEAPNVVVSAIKQAEDSDDLIVRCYESEGRATSAKIQFHFANRDWDGNFRPFEIKTLRFNARTGSISEVDILER